jgi:hypothetical protein
MLIFTAHDTSRFRYAADILFGAIKTEWEITTDEARFQSYTGPKLTYSLRSFVDALRIPVVGNSLWRGAPIKQTLSQGDWHGIPTLYAQEGDIPFDIFGAVFFMVSRYEEYCAFEPDIMGRFPSIRSQTGSPAWLERPVVDEWRMALVALLNQHWPGSVQMDESYRMYSTIDVDSAYAYIGKGLTRTCAGMAKDALRRDWPNLKHRIQTILGWRQDKYDTYDYIESVLQQFRCQQFYFFQLSDLAEFDRNVRYTSKTLRKRIKDLSREFSVGIHPGVRSNFKMDVLDEEKVRLENIVGDYVQYSRQHYLMLRFPKTYQELLRVGITEDFTMGYADAIGFRAGTSLPFNWYDISLDRVTSLRVHPITMMDTTLRKYMKLTPDEAMLKSRLLIDRIRAVHGQCVILWHNETLSESDGWQGWRRVWEDQLAYGNG